MAKFNKKDWIIVGISGVTCGGKTTLANRLYEKLTPAYIFHQDKYFYPDDSPIHVKCKNLDHNNYDILSSLDMNQMYKDILSTLAGENKAHKFCLDKNDGKIEIKNKKILIVEGFTVLNFKPILEICDLNYYFVLEYSECMSRRCYRLYDPPDIDGYFDSCVWPEHLKYRAEVENDSRINIFDGTRHDAFEVVMNHFKQLQSTEAKS